jgi:hypothetical protein
VRSLTVNRETLTMAGSAIAAEVDEAFDVQADLTTEIAFHTVSAVDDLTDLRQLGFSQNIRLLVEVDVCFSQNFSCRRPTDAKNIGQSHFHPLTAREVHSRDTSHFNYLPFDKNEKTDQP